MIFFFVSTNSRLQKLVYFSLQVITSMATHSINIFSLPQTSSSLRSLNPFCTVTIPSLSFYSHVKLYGSFQRISLKPYTPNPPRSRVVSSALKNLSEVELISVPEDPQELAANFSTECGVYAVYDANDDLQFIGITRNITASISGHRKSLPELCSSVKVSTDTYRL